MQGQTPESIFQMCVELLTSDDYTEYRYEYEQRKNEIDQSLTANAKAEVDSEIRASKLYDTGELKHICTAIEKDLSPEAAKMIKNAFKIETFQMKQVQQGEHMMVFEVLKDSNKYKENITVVDKQSLNKARQLQCLSLAIELHLFVLSAVGIELKLDEDAMIKLEHRVESLIGTSKFNDGIKAFLDKWNTDSTAKMPRAKAVFAFLRATFQNGIFKQFMKHIILALSWADRLTAFAKIIPMMITAIKTKGRSLLVKITMALQNAEKLDIKVKNLYAIADKENAIEGEK